jgi:hypothetical protein
MKLAVPISSGTRSVCPGGIRIMISGATCAPTSIASPERRWRAAAAPLIAGVVGWVVAESVRLGARPGTSPELTPTAIFIVICGAVVPCGGAAGLGGRQHSRVARRSRRPEAYISIISIGLIGLFQPCSIRKMRKN